MDLAAVIARDGWAHVPRAGDAGLRRAFAALDASILWKTDVVVREGRALVTSDRALALHTDHHRAELIIWLCRHQTTEGGATLVADGLAAFDSLSDTHRAALAEVVLREHSVFPGDAATHPLLTVAAGRRELYYSFWLADASQPAHRHEALAAFDAAARRHVVANIRLAPGDLLVVDNRRMLHGRDAIRGSRARHLERYWLARSVAQEVAA